MSKIGKIRTSAATAVVAAALMLGSAAFAGDAQLYWKCSDGWCPATGAKALPTTAGQLPSKALGSTLVGAYSGMYPSNSFTGMAADAEILSMRWTGQYPLVVTSFSSKIGITGAFTTSQLVGFYCRKAEAYSVEDSGGTDISASIGLRLDSTSPALSGLSVREALASTGLTAGTRTLSNYFARDVLITGTGQATGTGFSSWSFRPNANESLVLRTGEGLVCFNSYLLGGSGVMRVLWGFNASVVAP